MEAVAIVFNSDKSAILCKNANKKYFVPCMEVPEHKDPMLFVYECMKDACGSDIIRAQMWYLKEENSVSNCYLDVSYHRYIGTCVLPETAPLLNDAYFWLDTTNVMHYPIGFNISNVAQYVVEAKKLLEMVQHG